jgi:tetratricopeptide (TPR) repeat protein
MFQEALAEQKKSVEMNPINAQSHYLLAQRYAQAGEYLNALQTLQEAIKLQASFKADAAKNTAFDKIRDFVEFKRLIGQ